MRLNYLEVDSESRLSLLDDSSAIVQDQPAGTNTAMPVADVKPKAGLAASLRSTASSAIMAVAAVTVVATASATAASPPGLSGFAEPVIVVHEPMSGGSYQIASGYWEAPAAGYGDLEWEIPV